MNNDARWMKVACTLAEKGEGLTRPNPPVGALVVRAGRVVGSGFHHRAGEAHAEILALRAAGRRAKGAALYVTLEPCCTHGRTGPCVEAIIGAGLGRVVVGVRDPNPQHAGRGLSLLRRAGIEVVEGLEAFRCNELIGPFRKWVTRGIPYVTLKMGMTLDGKIADADGRSKWITDEPSRNRVQVLRRKCDAVMVGAGTAMADDPGLLCEGRPGLFRVIVSSRGRLPAGLRLLSDRQKEQTIVAVSRESDRAETRRLLDSGVNVMVLPSCGRGRVSIKALLRRLGRMGLLHVLCEGGGTLAGELLKLGLIDEYWFFVSPRLMGGEGTLNVFEGVRWGLETAPRLTYRDCRRVGRDLLIRALPGNVQVEDPCRIETTSESKTCSRDS